MYHRSGTNFLDVPWYLLVHVRVLHIFYRSTMDNTKNCCCETDTDFFIKFRFKKINRCRQNIHLTSQTTAGDNAAFRSCIGPGYGISSLPFPHESFHGSETMPMPTNYSNNQQNIKTLLIHINVLYFYTQIIE